MGAQRDTRQGPPFHYCHGPSPSSSPNDANSTIVASPGTGPASVGSSSSQPISSDDRTLHSTLTPQRGSGHGPPQTLPLTPQTTPTPSTPPPSTHMIPRPQTAVRIDHTILDLETLVETPTLRALPLDKPKKLGSDLSDQMITSALQRGRTIMEPRRNILRLVVQRRGQGPSPSHQINNETTTPVVSSGAASLGSHSFQQISPDDPIFQPILTTHSGPRTLQTLPSTQPTTTPVLPVISRPASTPTAVRRIDDTILNLQDLVADPPLR